MAALRERPQLHDHEVDQRLREIAERVGTIVREPLREVPEDEPRVEKLTRRPIRWMQWLAVFVIVLVAGGAMLLMVIGDDDAARTSTYVGDPYAELEMIDQLAVQYPMVDRYVSDTYAELALIEQAVARYGTFDRYVSDAYAELDLIERAAAAFDAGQVG